jgi:drug/metabolite transporter (DMT)-like permease
MEAVAARSKMIAAAFGCIIGGPLVAFACHVQGGLPVEMLPDGCGLGAAIGYAVASRWIRPAVAAASVAAASAGAVSGLTLFQCLPCDGSNVIMPAFNALISWGASVVVTLVNQTARSPHK